MTLTEKVKALQDYCATQDHCDKCILNSFGDCRWEGLSNTVIEEMYSKLPLPTPTIEDAPEETPVVNDVIKHPNHYCRDGAMECIDEMVLLFGKEAVKNFCLCNIWKYRYRSNAKNGEEDIKKSDRYVQIYKELSEDEPDNSGVKIF